MWVLSMSLGCLSYLADICVVAHEGIRLQFATVDSTVALKKLSTGVEIAQSV